MALICFIIAIFMTLIGIARYVVYAIANWNHHRPGAARSRKSQRIFWIVTVVLYFIAYCGMT